jgi:glutaminase
MTSWLPPMLTPEVRERINRRLVEMYERHRDADAEVASYYVSGQGYVSGDAAGSAAETFGVALASMDGETFGAGDYNVAFPLQSLSKVFVYGLALEDHGREAVHQHVGVEPSGDAFHTISFDERRHIPHNPMVNAGALATTDLVKGADGEERLARIVDLLRRCAADDTLEPDQQIFDLEVASADRNRATAYLMRGEGMIGEDVEGTLALYLKQCSVKVTARDLAVMAATFANGCRNPVSGEQVLSRPAARDLLTVMYTCGMYDFAGEWAYDVGVPAKSGVSGGIMACIPGKMGAGVFSPGLDPYGNSVRGVNVCHEVSERLGLHVFATDDEDAMMGPPAGDDPAHIRQTG